MASIRKRCGRYEVRVQHQGSVYSKTFGTEAEAKRWAVGVEHGFIEVSIKPNSTAGYPTLTEAIERYADEVSRKHRGARQELVRLGQLKRLRWAGKRLNKVTPQDVRELRDEMLAKGAATSSVRLMLLLVSAIFRHARREWGYKLENPVSEIRIPSPAPGRLRRLSDEEEKRLMVALSGCRRPVMGPLVRFALETGMRRSEMLRLRWPDIDFEKRLATLPTTKNGNPRWVPLTDAAVAALRESLAKGNRHPFDIGERNVEYAWKWAVKRAGLENLRFHDLRHEALSRWAHRLGGDVFKLSLVSGHKTLQMARRYVHPIESELLAAFAST